MSMQPGATATGARQRLILVVLAGALVLALSLALRPLVLNRVGEPTAAPTATTTASAAASTTTSTIVLGESDQPLPPTKDPFRPLVTPGVAAAAGAPAAASTPATGPTVQNSARGPGAATATVPGGGAAAAEQKVTLLGIVTESGARAARVEVDGTRYTVGEGESFAGDYRAVDIGSSCATFESGTSPFTLCEGEAVLK
jgi:hypothetical protein